MSRPEGEGIHGLGPTKDGRSQPGWIKAVRRYLPFVAIAAAIAIVVAVVGGGGDDGDDDRSAGGAAGVGETVPGEQVSNEELIRSGPMTPQRAELEGVEPDFGPDCDTATGRLAMPTVYAPPCVEPFTGDAGGATSMGVTGDEILVVRYAADPNLSPLQASIVGGAGADVNPETANQAVAEFADVYNEVFETYGRRVVVETFTGTGADDDEEAARADAIAIAEKEPFAVIGGPVQAAPAFADELGARGVLCLGFCATAVPESIIEAHLPYIWPTGPTPDQASLSAAEMIGKLAGPGPAELAGDPALQERERTYGLVWFDRPDGDQAESVEIMREALTDFGIEIAADIQFELDLTRTQENARTMISRLKEAGVTTVIYRGDPLTPQSLTAEATAQDYFPEWILGPSVLADTTIFGRLADGEQWKNGFGISTVSARGERVTDGAFQLYDWAYGGDPPNNTINVLEPSLRTVFIGIHLAGPELTPESFRDGLFRFPASGGGPTNPQTSRGDHGFWPDVDFGGFDDATIVWWDPGAEGEDETGNRGRGMYRYANGGQRYALGEFPESPDDAGLFDDASSVTVYDELPPEDQVPDYPRPEFERVLSAPGDG